MRTVHATRKIALTASDELEIRMFETIVVALERWNRQREAGAQRRRLEELRAAIAAVD
jgi:hypothetical protein